MHDDDAVLAREAAYLHALFFRRALPDAVIPRYVAANRLCFPGMTAADGEMMRTIVDRRLDAEAIELALRGGVLTRKIRILFYLVEVRSAYYGDFINQTPGAWLALLRLLAATLQSAWKLVKGRYLVWRHQLAPEKRSQDA